MFEAGKAGSSDDIYVACRENVVRNTFLSRRRGILLNWRTEETLEVFRDDEMRTIRIRRDVFAAMMIIRIVWNFQNLVNTNLST